MAGCSVREVAASVRSRCTAGSVRGAGDSSRARGFFATCPGGSEEAHCATAVVPFARFRRGSSSRESCQVGDSAGGPREQFRSRGRRNQERTRQSTNCGTREAFDRTYSGVQETCRMYRETVAQVGNWPAASASNRTRRARLCSNEALSAPLSASNATNCSTNSRLRDGSGSLPSSSGVGRHSHSDTR